MEHARPPLELSLEGGPAQRATAWRKWRQQFYVFLKAAGVHKETTDVQASLLVNLIGPEGYDIYTTFKYTKDENREDIDTLVKKFDEHFGTKQNTTMVRFKFFTRHQESGESIDEYVTALKILSEHCEFEHLEEGLIRDRIVCGVADSKVRDRLLRSEELTLQSALKICRASEMSNEEKQHIEATKSKGDEPIASSSTAVDVIHGARAGGRAGGWAPRARRGRGWAAGGARGAAAHGPPREGSTAKRRSCDKCGQRSASKHDEVHEVALGVVFEQHSEEIQEALKFAMLQYSNSNNSKNKTRLDFQLFVDIINTADVFKLSRLICHQFSRGVVSMLGSISPDSFDTLHSYTNTFQVPFVTPWFPEKVIPPTSGLVDYAVSLLPDYHRAVIDIIVHYRWKQIIYIYDSHDGLLRLQQLYQCLEPGKAKFQITYAKRVSKASEVIAFLVTLERMNRWSNKYVVLDCGTQLAKDTLVQHVHDIYLGRRNYHYFLTGLVMDNLSEKGVAELGAINVTGFSVLDNSRKFVQTFFEAWRRKPISAQAALMYDTVQVLIDSILRMLRRKHDFLRAAKRRSTNSSTVMDCNPGNALIPFEYGEKMSRVIKRTEMEGLTGYIRFTEEGRRRNFTLQVMEMAVNGDIVKVGTWYDNKGYVPIEEKLRGLRELGYYERNKTYIVSTIEEYPYVNKEKISDKPVMVYNLTGFCIDLTRLVLEKMEITYEIKLVKDAKYGSENAKEISGWDGLIGELLRKEADLVVAPLIVNRERQEVVDFSKPYLSFDTRSENTSPSNIYTIFTFLMPLSKEIWFCLMGSLFGVSLCLFLVSKFSPQERRVAADADPLPAEDNEITDTMITGVNEFNFWNSIWFSLGSFLQQGNERSPRSISGRIVSAVWCFFALIVISIYTANMASYFTVNRINEPLLSYTKVTKCPKDHMVPPPIQGEDGDHPWGLFLDDDKPCELMISITQSGVKEFAVAFPKGSKLREGVNLALQALREEGELQRLIRIWFIDTKCAAENRIEGKELTLSQVAGLFYVLVGGLTLAMMVALLEFMLHRRSHAVRARMALQKVLREGAERSAAESEPSPQRREPRDRHERLEWNGGAYSEYYASEGHGAAQEESELPASFNQV